MQRKDINFKVLPNKLPKESSIIISTTEKPYFKEGYFTSCFKTAIEYGYACLSKNLL